MAFFYERGRLRCGGPQASADLIDVARSFGTPAYVYDIDAIEERYRAFCRALGPLRASIHYAIKANASRAIVSTLASLGAGADVVSFGEVLQAQTGGIAPEKIIFSGVGKTKVEIRKALELGVKQLNVESPQELERIAKIASELGKTADVAFRMNPDVSPATHPYIATGFRENKFGMDESFMPELLGILKRSGNALRLRGLTLHIGSQLLDIAALREAIQKTKAVFRRLLAVGHPLDRFDVGGGVGIHYESSDESGDLRLLNEYGAMLQAELSDLGCEILLEPGRTLVGRAGALLAQVQYVKRAPTRVFVVLDTGMHHLIRPALYQAKHRLLALNLASAAGPAGQTESSTYDVVGPICESSDVLARGVELPRLDQDDFLAIADAGAYGMSMASAYNAHALPVEVAIRAGAASPAAAKT